MPSEILKKMQWRYACKKFDPAKTLSEEKLAVLKESFNLTATSYGLQPIKLIIIKNPVLKEQLVPLSNGQMQVRDASHVLVICIETHIDTQYIKTHFKRVKDIRDTPDAILDPFKTFLIESFAEKTQEEVISWMKKQAYLALGNLLTVCALEEIDSCPMEGFEPEGYDTLLELKEKGLQSVLVLPVGYRAEDDFFSSLRKVRKGVGEVIIEL
ncbi:MAG: NAD(P)H-dependent oxidoreductase [Flavobacteriaceae bacterium]